MNAKFICRSCGWTGDEGKTVTRGNFATELVLWLCLVVPGLIYSLWRVSSRYEACPSCGGKELIPTDSPIGRQLGAQLGVESRAADARTPSALASRAGRRLGKLFARNR